MKTTQPAPRQTQSGFTLIELLTVVAIIALLAGGSVGAYSKFINTVKASATQKNCVEIAGAVSTFYRDYDSLPVTQTGGRDESLSTDDASFAAILVGSKSNNDALKKNSRGINYLEGFKQAKRGKGGEPEDGIDYEGSADSPSIYDLWGNPYEVVLDSNFDGEIDNPVTKNTGGITKIRGKRAIVYSKGRPSDGNRQSTSETNWIKSW
jgi:prepilin-type N-terminal cleavage/methylation domain-containing protein